MPGACDQFCKRHLLQFACGAVLTVLATALLGASCSATSPTRRDERFKEATTGREAGRRIDATAQRSTDDIVDFDFVIDAAGVLHVTWITRHRSPLNSSYYRDEVWYVRRREGKLWEHPMLLDSNGAAPLASIASAGQLQIIYGRSLNRLISDDNGLTWRQATPVHPKGGVEAIASAADAPTVLAYAATTARMDSNGDRIGTELSLYSATLTSDSVSAKALVCSFPGQRLASPHVATSRAQTGHIAIALAARERLPERPTDSGVISAPTRGRVFWFTNDGLDASWSPPTEVISRAIGHEPRYADPSPIQQIDDVAIVAAGRDTGICIASYGIYMTRVRDGIWQRAQQVAAYDFTHAATGSPSLEVVGDSLSGWIVWIDERYQREDPGLASAALSDDLKGSKSDVFGVPLAALFQSSNPAALSPRRLSRRGYTRQLRAHAAASGIYVMWAGQEQQGKLLSNPLALFMTVLVAR